MVYNGKYTIENSNGEHRTFSIKTQSKDANFAPGKRVIGLLTGSNNELDYTGFAFLSDDDEIVVWKSKRIDASGKPTIFMWYKYILEVLLCGFPNTKNLDMTRYKVFEERRCMRCNRTLTTPESIQRGIGPECAQMS